MGKASGRKQAAAAQVELPAWAMAGDKRRAHIGRVVALLDEWAAGLKLDRKTALAWHDAGRLHDALRDAPDEMLRELTGAPSDMPDEMLHGYAAAARLESEGEKRSEMLEAVRYHTVGNMHWRQLGRALYMADYLEPGRKFSRADRAFLALQVPRDFDGTFRQVVRARIEWTVREGYRLFPETVEMWNAVR